mmetsp:Transcript_15306/g.33068  ORF Transcript_15306/g.33068 Transcript_15306/m.33068 type:complete len:112 (+) Transcript_15306:454-789(+)
MSTERPQPASFQQPQGKWDTFLTLTPSTASFSSSSSSDRPYLCGSADEEWRSQDNMLIRACERLGLKSLLGAGFKGRDGVLTHTHRTVSHAILFLRGSALQRMVCTQTHKM